MSNNEIPNCEFDIVEIPEISYFEKLSVMQCIHYIFYAKAYLSRMHKINLISKQDKEKESTRVQSVVIGYVKKILEEQNVINCEKDEEEKVKQRMPNSKYKDKRIKRVRNRKKEKGILICMNCQQEFRGHGLARYCSKQECKQAQKRKNRANFEARRKQQ